MKLFREMLAYLAFIAVVGVFSAWPDYKLLEDDRAVISMVFSHAGQRIGDCRTLTQDELNTLPPNMRKLDECPRQRFPVTVELHSGDTRLYGATLMPSGVWADGKSSVYNRIEVDAGLHELHVTMVDGDGAAGYDYILQRTVNILPGQNLVIRFDEERQSFVVE